MPNITVDVWPQFGAQPIAQQHRPTGPAFFPYYVPEIDAGYWWHPFFARGLGTTDFSVPEGNDSIQSLVQATVASQPTALAENGSMQFRMRNAANANPSLIGTAAAFAAGWTGPTYLAGWFRLPSGVPTGNGSLAQHNTTTGNQNRINLSLGNGSINGNVSTDGIAGNLKNNSHTTTVFNDAGWHWCEEMFLGVGATDADKLPVLVDFVTLTRTGGVVGIPASLFDATARFGVACRFQNALANVDTTDWAGVYYGNGIPSLTNRIYLRNYRSPIVQDWSLLP